MAIHPLSASLDIHLAKALGLSYNLGAFKH
jgi:hypothetical protein